MDEVDVQPVDLGLELRQRVQSCLAAAPVVLGRPVAREVLYRRQLHTLRAIVNQFPGRPARRIDAAAQLVDLALRCFDSERPDRALRARGRGITHNHVLPIRVRWASCRSSGVATSKGTSVDEHRAEDSMKREAAHTSYRRATRKHRGETSSVSAHKIRLATTRSRRAWSSPTWPARSTSSGLSSPLTGDVNAGRPAEMCVGDSLVMVSETGERDAFPALLYIYVDDADCAYERAVAAGAALLEPPLDTAYGDRRAMVRDPFGNVFQIAHRKFDA